MSTYEPQPCDPPPLDFCASRPKWKAFAETAKRSRFQWFRYEFSSNASAASTASRLKKGLMPESAGFEVTSCSIDGHFFVYFRYVGDRAVKS